jgi:ABC-type lipoprotein release transport system permease subunit
VGTRDPLSFLAGPCVVLAVVLVASALPAGRAARIDPVRALREDA